jgi:pilus assembly protein FimV
MATKNVNRFRILMMVSGLVLGGGSGSAFAVGLGNITLQSALYQPLNARIELVDIGGLEASDFHIGLASNDEFARAGLDRTHFLSDISFTPVIESGRRSYIRVTSARPVNEPYLSFLVGLELPGGRQLREFTVLVDPPGYHVPASSVASRSDSYAQVAAPRPVTPRAPRSSASAPVPAPRPGLQAGTATYTTRANDTLWQIAQNLVRQAGKGSVQQTMDDLYLLNTTAFTAGDIHRLRVGQTLRLPAEFSAPAAAGEQGAISAPSPVAGQGAAHEQRALPEVPVTPASAQVEEGQAASAVAAQQDQLLLRMAELQTQLEELQTRLDETVKSKDNQIMALQQEVAQLRSSVDSGGVAAPVNPSLIQAQPSLPDNSAVIAPSSSQDPSQATTIAPPATPALPEENAPKVTDNVASPMPVQADAEPGSSFSSYYLWLVPLAALLVAALAALRRRRTKEESAATVVAEMPNEVEPERHNHVLVPLVEPAVIASHPKPDVSKPQTPIIQQATRKVDDEFLGRAEIYLAYGRYNQAREVLEEGINEQPDRLDMRMMLLQVLAALGERKLFAVQEAAVRELGGDAQAIEQLKALLPGMVQEVIEEQPFEANEKELLEESFDLPDDLEEQWKPQLDLRADEMKPTQADIENFDLDLQDLSFDDAIALTELLDAEQGHEKAKPAESLTDDFPYTLGELPSVDELDMPLDEHFAGHMPSASVADNELNDYPASPLLQQAKTCMQQGDMRAASAILQRILNEGDDAQRHEAEVLLARIA